MKKKAPTFASIALICIGQPGVASDIDSTQEIIAEYENSCTAAGGKFAIIGNPTELVDLTGDGQSDMILDTSWFSCSTAFRFFCGTGGCSIFAIVDEKVSEFLAHSWKVVEFGDDPVLLLQVHGSYCGTAGAGKCYQAVVWDEGGFRTR